MKPIAAVLCFLLSAGAALAVAPGTDLFIPSVGHAQGACVDGVCSQWRTAVWIYNPSTTSSATVTAYFLERNKDNTTAVSQAITVAAGETKEYLEFVNSPLGVSGKYGALRFTSDLEVMVTGRIYDANVLNSKQVTGTTGQFYAGLAGTLGIGNGEYTDIIGLAQDAAGSTGIWRSNFGFVETTGATCTVEAQLLDSTGAALAAAKTYSLQPRDQKQDSIANLGGPFGLNRRVRVKVTGGNGKVIAFGSRIDNRTADPSTVEMWARTVSAKKTGLFDGIAFTTDGLLIDGGIEVGISSAGLTGFAGVVGIPCGTDSFVVDFSATAATPIPLGADGSFTTQVQIAYSDGTSTVFTSNWTLAGTLASEGAMSGTLKSETSGGAGSWASCNGTATRNWRAGWAKNP
ncbi:MAG: hypothetical protein V1750_03395 [Acidobacteriota bacterium]